MKNELLHKVRTFRTADDLVSLLTPEQKHSAKENISLPTNEVESALYAIWKNVLGHDNFGVKDDFFQAGGNSLKVVQLASRISREFNVYVQLTDLFLQPTIEKQASHILGQNKTIHVSPITSAQSRPEHIPLSFSQERLWFIDRLEGSVQYHTPEVLHLSGAINIEALNFALQNIVNRHEVLRTVIREDNGTPYQYIKNKSEWQLSVIENSQYYQDPGGLQQYIDSLINQPFDLSQDDMIRAHLIVVNELEHILVITMHHIASDGWSMPIFVNELVELYASYVENRPAQLEPLEIQYADYSIWQRHYVQGEQLDKKINYWKSKLDGVAALQLPTDYPRPAVQGIRGALSRFNINTELRKEIQQLSNKQGSTLYMTLLTAFKVLMHRYSGQQDICIGSPTAGRQYHEIENLIGFFVNTLALRSEMKSNISFTEFLQQVKSTTLEAYENQEAPFEKVVNAVVKERDISRSPLFQVMFVLQNTPDVPQLNLGDLTLSRQDFTHDSSKFDLSFFITESADGLQLSIEYNTDLYTEQTIMRMGGHYNQLLSSIVKDPHQEIGKLPILTRAEEHQLIVDFNDTAIDYPKDKTVIQLFEENVAKSPEASALIFEEQVFSYQELNQKANQLAHYLIGLGIGKETIVPICIERGPLMIIGLLGILKTGAAFVPIDPEYPFERINYMLNDTGALIVISSYNSKSKLQNIKNLSIIEIDESWKLISTEPVTNPPTTFAPDSLAYVIYTSGSTGKPKGVMIEHLSLVNLLTSIIKDVQFKSDCGFLSVTTFSFDICYLELFVPLISGGKLIVVSRDTAIDGYKLADSISQFRPTHMQGTPATWQLLLDSGWKNKEALNILIGGEALKENLKDQLTEIGVVYNLYGPTETTIWSTITPLQNGTKVSIGKPIANTDVFIVNEQFQLCPINVTGEICIAGDGLARGYLHLPELTDEKFVQNPFNSKSERMYKTGDLGRWLSDGNIEYSRRKDDQVKIRGYRIELGDIETALLKSGLVSQGVVLVKEDKLNNKKLVGYYIPQWHVIKQKERELSDKQVASWKDIYETEYATSTAINEEFDIGIWNDSFTGLPIPEVQMQEWLEDIVKIILSGQPQNVLEIGCGSGLIYYQLAGKIKKYIGTDFSGSSINRIKERINKGLRDYGPTELQICAAHEISVKPDQKIDTIILNSVVQYFPGEDYMDDVINKSICLLKDGGRIIIGDVRDNRLLELFKIRLLLQKLQPSVSLQELKWLTDQEVLREEELCFSPEYFFKLKLTHPQITDLELKWKQTSSVNELTLYRYTVILHIGVQKNIIKPDWQDWTKVVNHNILGQLQNHSGIIAIKNAPNPRLSEEQKLDKALTDQLANSVSDLLNTGKENMAEEIIGIINIAQASGYQYQLLLNDDPLLVNVLFHLDPSIGSVHTPFLETYNPNTKNTNTPLFNDISLMLQKEIRTYLLQQLPEYMVPSELIAMSNLPLTNNGKVDRKFLTEREDRSIANTINFELPQSKLQQSIANIWQDLLGIEQVGIHDNFFEIGGHSLLATRVISSIRKQLNVEVSIKDLFLNPNISALSFYIEGQSNGLLLPVIEPQSRHDQIPLSFSQERLWFIDHLEGSAQYHLPLVLRLTGDLDKKALTFALQNIVNRHEVLRTTIREQDGEAYQSIREKDGWQLTIINGAKYKDNRVGFQHYIDELIHQPFVLSKDNMLRAHLIKLEKQEHVLVITMHHIASDGWSIAVVLKELSAFYRSFAEKKQVELLPLKLQYADYALWQRRYLQGELLNKKISYWKEKLQDVEPLQLPTDYPRPAIQSTKGAALTYEINAELTEKLYQLSKQQGTTLFITLLAAFKVMLYRYSNQEDICVGSVVSDRKQQEVEDLVGFFVNTLVLRSKVTDEVSFINLLQQVRTSTLEAYENQEVPFEKVVEVVVKERDMSRNPLFQVMFVWQNTPPVTTVDLGGVKLQEEVIELTKTKFDITFTVTETGNGLHGIVEYCTDLYKKATIERMVGHFNQLLLTIVNKPHHRIGTLSMLTRAEESQLQMFNDTTAPYPKDNTIVDLFKEQVIRAPGNIAVVFNQQSLTYQELNEKTNQLASYLRTKGVTEETMVPVCLRRSTEMIIAMIGILKAGGAYVPIDPDYPAERIGYMLEDTGAALVISDKENREKIPGQKNLNIVDLNGDWPEIDQKPVTDLDNTVLPDHLVYVIYTSGSTGKPKGVMIEHRSLANLIAWHNRVYNVSELSRATAMAGVGFDAFGWEIWPYLAAGASIYVVDDEIRLDPCSLLELINVNNISHSFISTALVPEFISISKDTKISLQFLLTGGDKLSPLEKEGIDYKVVNNYGPTEFTVVTTYYELPGKDQKNNPPIGKPVANATIKITNRQQVQVPIGVPGEIYIGGVNLARGYLNHDELTAEKFVNVPFENGQEKRMYRSGDMGRWLPDGNIEYLGRIDDQVKIRGYRIEPGEIESVLLESGLVRQVVIMVIDDDTGNNRLVAYVVANGIFDKRQLVSYLQNKLPRFMIPALWVNLDSLPLTHNGKIDKKSLPFPDVTELISNEFVAPQTEVEEKLVSIWKELLHIERVGVNDDFFELGGHSLLAKRMASYIERKLLVSIPMHVLFQFTTIKDLGKYLEIQLNIYPGEKETGYKLLNI